jgi:hypothetical protein
MVVDARPSNVRTSRLVVTVSPHSSNALDKARCETLGLTLVAPDWERALHRGRAGHGHGDQPHAAHGHDADADPWPVFQVLDDDGSDERLEVVEVDRIHVELG